jgi:hypothetical protein
MSSLQFVLAEGATAVGINSQSNKTAAANVASTVAAALQALGKQDFAALNSQVATVISSIKDPGLNKFATDLASQIQPWVQAEVQLVENTPVLGGSVSQWITDTGAGMASAAGAYLTSAAAVAAKADS